MLDLQLYEYLEHPTSKLLSAHSYHMPLNTSVCYKDATAVTSLPFTELAALQGCKSVPDGCSWVSVLLQSHCTVSREACWVIHGLGLKQWPLVILFKS
eukprot:6382901-Amphidinium_carterae.2